MLVKNSHPVRRRVRRVLSIVVATVLGMSLLSPAAQAAWNGMLESMQYRGRCLDSDFAGNVYMKGCDWNNPHHRWLVEFTGTTSHGYDEVRLKNSATNRYLTQWRPLGPALATQPRSGSQSQVFAGMGSSWSWVSLVTTDPAAVAYRDYLCVVAHSDSDVSSANWNENGYNSPTNAASKWKLHK
jgi:hypothetical protein